MTLFDTLNIPSKPLVDYLETKSEKNLEIVESDIKKIDFVPFIDPVTNSVWGQIEEKPILSLEQIRELEEKEKERKWFEEIEWYEEESLKLAIEMSMHDFEEQNKKKINPYARWGKKRSRGKHY